jgi:hypothetical protein
VGAASEDERHVGGCCVAKAGFRVRLAVSLGFC